MPSKDLKSAFRYWVHLRRLVIHNKLDKSNYWKEKDDKNFHVRPKGTKENYRNNAPTPYDEKVDNNVTGLISLILRHSSMKPSA